MSDLQLGIAFLVGWFGGIASAFAIPWLIKSRHIARQNLLIEACRTRFILEYFGEPVEADWTCENCDACDAQHAFATRTRRVTAAV